MQGAVVMVIALSGLGCNNKSCDVSNAPPGCRSTGCACTNAYAGYAAPSSHSGYDSRSYRGDDSPAYTSHVGLLRGTIYSFVFGHDPDVPTAREIEESVYGRSGSGH